MIWLQTVPPPPDPNTVVAGWIPMVLVAVLGLAMVLLFRSMRKQMRRIDIPENGVPTRGSSQADVSAQESAQVKKESAGTESG
ncbi:hypothetical protein AADG42_15040 [Ammonicoccus fulvus]|uniref:Uncharacterized protein n=1 Tax=Ammonicoccus fulvus TaxID=3138240 RepID=A0ABZ3FR60_9ACTN